MSKSKSKEEASYLPDEPIKVTKWDATSVKTSLDDTIRLIFTQKLNYTEDYKLVDGRLLICGAAVFISMFALLWDYLHPFPASGPVLIVCVVSYFVLTSFLNVYTSYIEKDIFVVCKEKDPAGCDPDSRWEASSIMKKYDDVYDLKLKFTDGKTKKTRDTGFKRSCADFIDENGELCGEILESAILKLVNSLASEKKDS